MNTFHFFFLILLLTSSVSATGYVCQSGTYSFSPPKDLSQPLFWPSTWNDSMSPAPYEPNHSCMWDFEVPEGVYATAVFYKDTPSDISIFALWPGNQNQHSPTTQIGNDDVVPYIFTSPKFSVWMINPAKQGAFSIKVTWSKYPTMNVNNVKLTKGGEPALVIPAADLNVFTAETVVSLAAFTVKDASKTAFLRHSAVFDGDSTSGGFLGSLWTILLDNSYKPVVSSGKTLSVYTFGLDKQFDYTLYMAQDHANVQDLFTYRGVNCPTDSKCSVEVSAVFGPGAFVTVGAHPEFLTGFDRFPENGSLKVYEGTITDQNLVTTLTNDNYRYRLPMELKNTMRHYVLSNERLQATLWLDPSQAKWNKVDDGRKGFVHSFYHGENSSQQDTDETFTTNSPAKLYFNYIVRDSDLPSEQTGLTVTVSRDGKVVSSTTYNSKSLPPNNAVSVLGDTFNVKYESHGTITKGFRLDFSVTSAGYVTSSGDSTTSPTTPPAAVTSSVAPQKTVTTPGIPTHSYETTTKGVSERFTILAISGALLFAIA